MNQAFDSLLRRAARRTKRVISQWLTPQPAIRHENAFATLLPILTALATKREIRRVVEFGCGFNSTFNFLNREIFPNLESIISVENDPEWCNLIQQKIIDDRLTMLTVDGSVASVVTAELLANSQLILVDDSTCATDRANTIRQVALMIPPEAILVIHDFEVPNYQEASAIMNHRFTFDALLPNTGVLANEIVLPDRWLRRANGRIRKFACDICPTNTVQWRKKLKNL